MWLRAGWQEVGERMCIYLWLEHLRVLPHENHRDNVFFATSLQWTTKGISLKTDHTSAVMAGQPVLWYGWWLKLHCHAAIWAQGWWNSWMTKWILPLRRAAQAQYFTCTVRAYTEDLDESIKETDRSPPHTNIFNHGSNSTRTVSFKSKCILHNHCTCFQAFWENSITSTTVHHHYTLLSYNNWTEVFQLRMPLCQ